MMAPHVTSLLNRSHGGRAGRARPASGQQSRLWTAPSWPNTPGLLHLDVLRLVLRRVARGSASLRRGWAEGRPAGLQPRPNESRRQSFVPLIRIRHYAAGREGDSPWDLQDPARAAS